MFAELSLVRSLGKMSLRSGTPRAGVDSLARGVRFTRAARYRFHKATPALEECFAQGADFAKE